MEAHEIAMREEQRATLTELDKIAVQLETLAGTLGRVKIYGCDAAAQQNLRFAHQSLEVAAGLVKSAADA